MLLQQIADPTQTSGLGRGGDFKIANSPKAFEILSSNLYQDKPLAVIREISCNAADAHKITGRPISDIKVHLPTYGEPYFSVRDFGPGLSPDEIFDLYTTYFKSGKDHSNDFIGGFGLGSKAPFSIADQFSVTSWHGGQRSEYIMYKNSGTPQVNAIRQTPDNSTTGLEVKVAVTGNISDWISRATSFFAWWKDLPTFNVDYSTRINSMLKPDNIAFGSKTILDGYPLWAIFKEISYTNSITAFMGLVPYKINLDAIVGLPADAKEFLSNKKLVLAFRVGELNISPSREALSYDQQTCRTLLDRLKSIADEYAAKVKAALANQPNLYSARVFVYAPGSEAHFIGPDRPKGLTWRGKPIKRGIHHNITETDNPLHGGSISCSHLAFRPHHPKAKWRRTSETSNQINHHIGEYSSNLNEIYIWVPALTAKAYRNIQYHYEQIFTGPNYKGSSAAVIVYAGMTFDVVRDAFIELGMPPLIDASNLPDPPKAPPGTKTTRPVTKGYIYGFLPNGALGDFSRTETDIDLTTGGVYIDFWEGEPSYLMEFLRAALQDKIIDKPAAVIGLRRSTLATKRWPKLLAENGWVAYDKAWVQTNLSTDYLTRVAVEHVVVNHARSLPVYSTLPAFLKWALANPKSKWAGWRGFADFIDSVPTHLATNIASEDFSRWSKLSDGSFPRDYKSEFSTTQLTACEVGAKIGHDIVREHRNFLNQNELIKHIDRYRLTQSIFDSVPSIVDYLNR